MSGGRVSPRRPRWSRVNHSCTAKTKLRTQQYVEPPTVEEELVQQNFAGPHCVGEEWLRATIFQFDAIVCLVHLEMEQVFCKQMLCIRVHSMLSHAM